MVTIGIKKRFPKKPLNIVLNLLKTLHIVFSYFVIAS